MQAENIKSEPDYFEISVVIPAYNAEKYIARAIESVLNQCRPVNEIIIVDDGSTDRTAEIIKGYGDKVRYFYQENGGASAARNSGIKATMGEWVAFLDCDDEWLDEHLQRHVELLKRNSDLVWSSGNFISCWCSEDHRHHVQDQGCGEKILGGKEYFDDYFAGFIAGAAGCMDTIMVRRKVLEDVGMFTPGVPMGNDIDLWWRIAYRYPKIGYLTKPTAIYHRQIQSSISDKHVDPKLLCDLIERHLEISKSEGAYDRFKPCAVHMVKYWIYRYMFDGRVEGVFEMLKRFSGILKLRYRMIVRLLAMFPAVTMRSKRVIDKVSGPLGLRR